MAVINELSPAQTPKSQSYMARPQSSSSTINGGLPSSSPADEMATEISSNISTISTLTDSTPTTSLPTVPQAENSPYMYEVSRLVESFFDKILDRFMSQIDEWNRRRRRLGNFLATGEVGVDEEQGMIPTAPDPQERRRRMRRIVKYISMIVLTGAILRVGLRGRGLSQMGRAMEFI